MREGKRVGEGRTKRKYSLRKKGLKRRKGNEKYTGPLPIKKLIIVNKLNINTYTYRARRKSR